MEENQKVSKNNPKEAKSWLQITTETHCEGYFEKLPPLVEMLSLSMVANTQLHKHFSVINFAFTGK